MKVDELVALKDCTNFIIHDVCTNLGEEVNQLLADNQSTRSEVAGQIAAILLDLLHFEGREDEDHL